MLKLHYTPLIILFFAISPFTASAQKQPDFSVEGTFKDTSIMEILKYLEKNYPVKFTYIPEQLKDYRVSVKFRGDPLLLALDLIFEETPINYKVLDKENVLLLKDGTKPRKKLERLTVRGLIKNTLGTPLETTEIFVPALKKKIYSAGDGSFELTNMPKGSYLLRFRKAGYYQYSEIFQISRDLNINVSLTQSGKEAVNNSGSTIEKKHSDILNREIALANRQGTVVELLKELEIRGNFTFSYNDNDLPLEKQVRINNASSTVNDVLKEIFQNTRIEFIEWENKVILKARKANAQKFTISGNIKEKRTGEYLPGATVVIKGTNIGAVTNSYGFYSLTVPEWDYTLVFSYIGYSAVQKEISLNKDIRVNIELEDATSHLQEVVVTSDVAGQHTQSIEMSTAKLDIKTLKRMPAFMGEVDLIKSIVMLPGVTTVGEGATGFNVRGGSIDQNLVLLDEAQVYNSSHLFGFFSVFNADAIKESKLYKGGIPAHYGGRLSSVLDITQKEGNDKRYGGSGGIGLVSSRLSLEGPIVKNKGSFIIAGRRSYADAFFKNKILSEKLDLPSNNVAYFYDLNAKLNYTLNDNNKIYASGYFGRDNYRLGKDVAFSWGNTTATVRWNHLFNQKLFSNFTAVYSNYDYNQGEPEGYFAYTGKTGVVNYSLKVDFNYYFDSKHKIDFGLSSILYQIEPGKLRPLNDSSVFTPGNLPDNYATESALYVSDEWKLNSRLTIYSGLRYSVFTNLGPGKFYTYSPGESRTLESLEDTLIFSNGEIANNNGGFEPRVSLKYELNKSSSVKVSYNRMRQYIHLISNTIAATPLDYWKASNRNIKPQTADQIALGYFLNLREKTLEASVEVYYKNMQNLVDFRNGADLILNEMIDADLLQGKGRAYGIEFLLNKKVGRLTGWTSYTYSRTERKIKAENPWDQINYGDWYPANYDQPHKVNIVALFQLSRRISISSTFTYNTGRPATYPDAQYTYLEKVIPHYSTRNFQRIPDYHRIDFSATLEGRGNKWWKGSWTLAFYNIYGRKNAYSIFFRQVENTRNTETVRLSIIGSMIPSLSYNFNF